MRLKQAIYYLLKKINLIFKKIMVTDTASGAIASFPDGSDLLPALSLVANIVPQQSGTGTPSPENIRPISGWESVSVTDAGKNLLENASDSYSIANATYHTYTVKNLSSYLGKEMTFSIVTSDMRGKRIALYKSGDLIKVGSFGVKSVTATMPAFTDSDTLRLYLQDYTADAVAITGAQLELGTTATAYEPYTATTHTTSLGRTVYGGTVDVVSGVLTVTHGIVDLGSLDWLLTGGIDDYFYTTIPALKNNTGWTVVPNLACEIYQTTYPNAIAGKTIDKAVSTWKSGNRLIVRDTSYTDATAFKTAVSGQMLCYELATPQTYQLTPQTINTLSGVNNVWAESGDCSIEYIRDIGLALDNLLPDSPTTDGTYTLVCTVSDGKATIAWQSSEASLSSPLSMSSPASLNINTTEGE